MLNTLVSLLLLLLSLCSSSWLCRTITKDAIIIAPAVTLMAWSIVMGLLVGNNVPVSAIWLPFWSATALSAALSVFYLRTSTTQIRFLFAAALCTIVILAPYFVYGISTYPGSWFWDGFAYLATGETLWSIPRNIKAINLEPLYVLGQFNSSFRFTASSFIAVFRDVLPLAGDSQGSVGYFLVICVLTYSCSCIYLAKRALPPGNRLAFVVLATINGQILNLIWANNFDHLLALSLSPALTGFAFEFDFTRKRHALSAGIGSAALLYIYPELAAFLLLPSASILMFRVASEGSKLKTALIVTGVAFILTLLPITEFIYQFVSFQLSTVTREMGLRPGNGYFPTLLNHRCFYGSVFGFYSPFQSCGTTIVDTVKSTIGIGLMGCAVVGALKRRDGISAAAAVILSAAMYFIIVQKYDYAAFKLLCSATPTFMILAVSAFNGSSLKYRIPGAALGLGIVLVTTVRIAEFDAIVREKSISKFKELASAVPDNSVVALKIADPLLFEWATYYFRSTATVPVEGRFIYIDPKAFDNDFYRQRSSHATHLLTDGQTSNRLLWSNSLYRLYDLR